MKAKTVLITGASRGIGRETALEFARHGCNIVINSFHNEEQLLETKEDIRHLGADCLSFLGDIGDYTFCENMIERTLQEYRQIDFLINNAGVSYMGLLSDMSVDAWDRIISTNLTSVFYCCKQVIPHMVSRKCGRIINVSSMWGEVGASCEVAYSAAKGGLNAFTKALAKELAPSNIQVNAVSCGLINTAMNNSLSDEDYSSFVEEIPAGRAGEPHEVAEFIYQIAHSAPYLNGQIIRFDGGLI